MEDNQKTYSLEELASLTGLTTRTVRYYIQRGLADRPVGERRAARYTGRHLEQLLRVRRLTLDGFSLDRISRLAAGSGARTDPPPGTITVRSHVRIANGLELIVDPAESGLAADQLRDIVNEILACLKAAVPHALDGARPTNAPGN